MLSLLFSTLAYGANISKSNWSLRYTDSQEIAGEPGAATNAFDGNNATIWHTAWSTGNPPCPHEIQIDLGATYDIDGFSYLPRQDGGVNGRIAGYEFYISSNGTDWSVPVATGTFANNALEKVVTFTSQSGRFVRLRALSEVNGNPWTSAAEINVSGTLMAGNSPPDSTITLPASDVTINAGGTVNFAGTGSDPDGDVNLSYHWQFGSASGVPDSVVTTPGLVQFNTPGRYTVSFTVTDSQGLSDPTPATRIITVLSSSGLIPQNSWRLLYVDSQELVGENGAATNAFDGNNSTIWHTAWSSSTTYPPHEIQIDMGYMYEIDGFRYLPRQDGGVNGRISRYEFYVSQDGVNWGTTAASGTFNNDSLEKAVSFSPQVGRFIRLRAMSEVNGNAWTSAAEINVTGKVATAVPGTITVTPTTALTASGSPGGPFTPSSATYTLQNVGNTSVDWSASVTQPWVTLTQNSGTLVPGATTTVTVSINSNATSLTLGSFSDTVTFTNLTNGNGNTTRGVNLTIAVQSANIAPLATVTASSENPSTRQTAAKAVDGCIDGYPGNYTCEWATNGQGVGAWLTLSWPAPYSVNQVVLYDRPSSSENITSATITFSDGSSIVVGPLNNNGTATTYMFPARVITGLTMTVTGVSSSTVNIGLAEIQVYGTLAGGTQYSLSTNASPSGSGSVTVNPSQSGYYSGTQVALTAVPITGYTFSGWSGDASGTTNPLTVTMTRNMSITANFTAIPGTLTVTPATALNATGAPGGPFTPSSATYALQNTGNTAIDWSASATQPWVTLSSSSGSLAPGATTTVTVSINSNATSLALGSYSDAVTFTNLTNGNGNTTRGVNLTIAVQTTNIAPLATVTASSQVTSTGQTAAKAVDGCIDGYPGNYTCEWATNSQGVGAWLTLSWPAPYSVNQVVFYDRPSLSENITSATITFSDGSSIVVGPLNNNGTATTYMFPARVITGLTMTVTGVSGSTENIGLAEIQVYGTPSSSIQYNLTTNVTPSGSGSVAVNPNKTSYYAGEHVTLTAMPNSSYAFSDWSGDATGTTNPLIITIIANMTVTANFTAIPGTLSVTPSAGLTASGAHGGPFTPSNATYTLQNTGNTTINWSASATQNWMTLSTSSGSLVPGASTTVTASINSSANSLTVGTYSDTVNFTNATNGNGNTTRGVVLFIDVIAIQSVGGYTPVIAVTGSPSIEWTFPGGTPANSTSPTPGAVTFPDNTVRTSVLSVNPTADVTNFEIDLPEQANSQQSYEIQSIAGLEHLTGLTRLFLYDTGLTSLSNVNQLSSLQQLYCSNNFLGGTNQRWNGLTNLYLAHCFGNSFSAQEVDQLFIDLNNNGLSNGEFNLSANAGPSSVSAAARASLVARGNTLTYNPILSNPGYIPAVSTVGANIQVAGSTQFTVTAVGATDIKVDIQDVGVQHIISGAAIIYYLGNATQIRNITIEVTPSTALTGLTFQGSGRQLHFDVGNRGIPNGNIYSISGLDRFANLQHLAFYPANVLNHITGAVGANLTFLELLPGAGITSPLAGTDADSLIAALVSAGASNGNLYLPNRTNSSDANAVILHLRGWGGQF
jgi:uncharacterized repeat protein (TIGR02543 family)